MTSEEMQLEQFRQCCYAAKQETDTQGKWDWVEASIWTERMLTALVNGVKGGKWYSLFDKVCSMDTLRLAWKKVKSNRGAAGVDKISMFEYFKHAHKTVFSSIDGFVRRRLRSILRRQEKRPGRGICHADHKRWPNAFFATHGLFTMSEAHGQACRSR